MNSFPPGSGFRPTRVGIYTHLGRNSCPPGSGFMTTQRGEAASERQKTAGSAKRRQNSAVGLAKASSSSFVAIHQTQHPRFDDRGWICIMSTTKMPPTGKSMLSPKELAQQSGWPEGRIRRMIKARMLRHVRAGGLILLPSDAIVEFCKTFEVPPCQDNLSAPDSSAEVVSPISTSATSTPPQASRRTYQQTLETAKKRRRSSRNS